MESRHLPVSDASKWRDLLVWAGSLNKEISRLQLAPLALCKFSLEMTRAFLTEAAYQVERYAWFGVTPQCDKGGATSTEIIKNCKESAF